MTEPAHISELPPLPALRALGELADRRPCVIVDTREQTPLPITRLPVTGGTLPSGDYSFRGGEHLFTVERKTIPDLVLCCGPERERFTHELERMRGYDFARLLVIGAESDIREHKYRSRMEPKAVLHSLFAFEARFRLPVVYAPTPAAGAALIERWTWFYARELVERVNTLLRGAGGPCTGMPGAL